MKYALSLLALVMMLQTAGALEITRGVTKTSEKVSVGNANVISPTDVAEAMRPLENNLQYMLDNYSDAQLRQFAVSLNQQQIMLAKKNKTTPPKKLDNSILQSREKIAEYLRSLYMYQY